ncbi:MAG: hypothetical protein ABIO39_09635 [Caulobacteraceae bacterium]
MKPKRIVVMGFMAGMPIAGVIWQHLHYIVGLQRLGHEVYYVEDSARTPYDPAGFTYTLDDSYAVQTLETLSRRFGFDGRWAFCPRYDDPSKSKGLPYERVQALYREADAVLNVCGSQELHEDVLTSDRLIYIESDPGVEQILVDKGDVGPREHLGHYRALFTFGENVPTPNFPVHLNGLTWLATRQPVVIDFWKAPPPPAGAMFTSIANWNTGGSKDITWRGETYLWSKSLEFLKFIEAPRRCGEPFELAVGIEDADVRARFKANDWRLVDPHGLSQGIDDYRSYIQDSKAEFTAAKDQYVRLNTGWFSDRSACYLASGRPVITQDTGFGEHIRGEGGLFAFTTMAEVEDAAAQINADYGFHSRAANEIALEYFEATKVLASMLERAGI